MKKGVSEIEVKSDAKGWPKYKLNLASPNPRNHLFVNIIESVNRVGFDVNYT